MQPDLQTVQSNGALSQRAGELALGQNRVLRNTYLLLAVTMIPTVIGAMVGVNTNFSWLRAYPIAGPIGMFLVMMGLLFGVTKLRNSVAGIGLLLAFTFVAGWFLGPILQVALGLKNGAQLIGLAAGGTGVIFATMAGIATVTKRDFSFMGKFLLVGIILLIVASLANLFFQIPALALTLSAVAVLLFSMFILYDVSRIVTGGETNYVMATMAIYLNIYNLFVNLLQLLMAFAGNRE
jgi:modulator of FtsH protease